jgi:regulator of RNase E activity RraA
VISEVTAANIADACVRLGVSMTHVDGLRPLFPAARCLGRALPVVHFGSVDVFLDAFDGASPGDILVIDNENREDEGCIGDLTVLEARNAGIAGVVLWGRHRDTPQLLEIGLPIFSSGTMPVGPRGVRNAATGRASECRIGDHRVTRDDYVIADADGVLFFPAKDAERVIERASEIAVTERGQADRARNGTSLRTQFRWKDYVAARASNPEYTLREHLTKVGGAIEV